METQQADIVIGASLEDLLRSAGDECDIFELDWPLSLTPDQDPSPEIDNWQRFGCSIQVETAPEHPFPDHATSSIALLPIGFPVAPVLPETSLPAESVQRQKPKRLIFHSIAC